jgi:hypothetical protein
LAILSDATNGGYMARNPEIPNGASGRRPPGDSIELELHSRTGTGLLRHITNRRR